MLLLPVDASNSFQSMLAACYLLRHLQYNNNKTDLTASAIIMQRRKKVESKGEEEETDARQSVS